MNNKTNNEILFDLMQVFMCMIQVQLVFVSSPYTYPTPHSHTAKSSALHLQNPATLGHKYNHNYKHGAHKTTTDNISTHSSMKQQFPDCTSIFNGARFSASKPLHELYTTSWLQRKAKINNQQYGNDSQINRWKVFIW